MAVAVAFSLASCLAATNIANASSDSAVTGTGEVKQVAHTTAKSSGKLKWLPYRPQPGDAEDDGTHTEYAARWTSAVTPKDSQQPASSTLDAPFGDKQSSVAAESVEGLNEPLILPSAGPGGGSASPNFRQIAKSTGAQSLVPQGKENAFEGNANGSHNPNTQEQTLEQALSAKNPDMNDICPTVKDLKKISQLSTNITPSQGDLPRDCPWGGEDFRPRSWAPVTFTWTASALCHHPLYFEDIQVERYGHTLGPWLQPFASGAHFFLTLPILPYKMGLELPDECMYSLGYYRPGSCAPYMLDPLPLSIRAGLFEAGAWVGGAAIIP